MTPEYCLASSALKDEGFDGLRTIEEAVKGDFGSVQLFVDKKYRNPEYLESIITNLKDSDLEIVLHLPNTLIEEDVKVAEKITQNFPDTKVLIHFEPTTTLSLIENTIVGWENSLIGRLDQEMRGHIEAVTQKVQEDDTFLVFDMGRLLYAGEKDVASQEEVIAFVKDQISKLDPTKDIIHFTDKTSWELPFREVACILGDGIMGEFMEDLANFEGQIVFEYENLGIALKSLKAIKEYIRLQDR